MTATIDPLDRVTASTYDQYGNVTDTYQGQIAASADPAGTWTFSNLSPVRATGTPLFYDVYVDADSDPSYEDYQVTGGSFTATANADPAAPSLGVDWLFLGTVNATSVTTPPEHRLPEHEHGHAPQQGRSAEQDFRQHLRPGGRRDDDDRRPEQHRDLRIRQPEPPNQ